MIKCRSKFKHGSTRRGRLTSWNLLDWPSSGRSICGMIMSETFVIVSLAIGGRRSLGVTPLRI